MSKNFVPYRILIIIFLCFIVLLAGLNFKLLESINSRKALSVSAYNVDKVPEYRYGYTDILKIIEKDTNLNIVNMENEVGNGNTVRLNLRFTGPLEKLYSSISALSSESCFVSVEDIKISTEVDKNNINFAAVFMKTK